MNEKKLKEELAKLIKKKQQYIYIMIVVLILVFAICTVSVGVILSNVSDFDSETGGVPFLFGAFFGLFADIVVAIFMSAHLSKINKEFKPSILKPVFSELLYNYQYDSKENKLLDRSFVQGKYDEKTFYHISQIRKTSGNRYVIDDYLEGNINGIQFSSIDALCCYTSHNGKTSTTSYLFHGRIYRLRIDVDTTYKFLLVKDSERHKEKYTPDGYQSIDVSDEVFEKTYNCYTNNKAYTKEFFTQEMIQRIQNFTAKIKGTIFLCIEDEELIFGINDSKDNFELKIDSSLETLKESIQFELDRIQELYQIIKGDDIYETSSDCTIY